MSEELKPCPFCGSKTYTIRTEDGRHWVECLTCFTTGPAGSKYDGEEDEPCYKPEWNTRPIEDALRARVEELERNNIRLEQEAQNISEMCNGAVQSGLGYKSRADGLQSQNEMADELLSDWKESGEIDLATIANLQKRTIAAEEQVKELVDNLNDLLNLISNSREGHIGGDVVYCPQINTKAISNFRSLIAKIRGGE